MGCLGPHSECRGSPWSQALGQPHRRAVKDSDTLYPSHPQGHFPMPTLPPVFECHSDRRQNSQLSDAGAFCVSHSYRGRHCPPTDMGPFCPSSKLIFLSKRMDLMVNYEIRRRAFGLLVRAPVGDARMAQCHDENARSAALFRWGYYFSFPQNKRRELNASVSARLAARGGYRRPFDIQPLSCVEVPGSRIQWGTCPPALSSLSGDAGGHSN